MVATALPRAGLEPELPLKLKDFVDSVDRLAFAKDNRQVIIKSSDVQTNNPRHDLHGCALTMTMNENRQSIKRAANETDVGGGP